MDGLFLTVQYGKDRPVKNTVNICSLMITDWTTVPHTTQFCILMRTRKIFVLMFNSENKADKMNQKFKPALRDFKEIRGKTSTGRNDASKLRA